LSDQITDSSNVQKISSEIDRKHQNSKLKGNEILIACVGATIGKIAWLSDDMKGWNIARAVIRIPIKKDINREYIYRYIQSPIVQGFFAKETRSVAQPTLNVGLIAKTPIALPPIELQMQFLEKNNRVLNLKNRLVSALNLDDQQFNSLSQKAFSGQL